MNENTSTTTNQTAPNTFDIIDRNTLMAQEYEPLQFAVEKMFVATVRKYTRAKKLTQRMLNELVDYIEVYHAEKADGVKTQKLKIHYNCVGSIEIPNILPLLQPEVLIQTRKGCSHRYHTDNVATSQS